MSLVKIGNGMSLLLEVIDVLEGSRVIEILKGIVDISMRRRKVVAGKQG